ncbi:MAG: NAD(P)-dependent oxidoreductase [Paludibacter sp.]|nr:NAD(P)-dependent oxidoreductase [Paludibacter sp.]
METIKTVLLTGATGYLGSRLMEKMLKANYRVCIIKRENSILNQIKNFRGDFKFYNNDDESIKQAFLENNIDLIVHTATLYGRKGETILQIKEANLDFPLLVLKYAIEYNVGYFINTGTSLPIYTNQYALFKNQFSQCLEFLSSKINVINVLLEHFYGPGDEDSKFITGMIHKMKQNVPKIELTLGIQIRDFIFIEDVLTAYFVLIKNLDKFKDYNSIPLGSGVGITIKEVVKLIKVYSESHSELVFGAIPMRETELMKSDANISKLNELGWFPKYSIEDGLKLVIQSEHK